MPQAPLVRMVGFDHARIDEPGHGQAEVQPLAEDDLGPDKRLQGERLPRQQGHVAGMQIFPRAGVGGEEFAGRAEIAA